MKRLATPTPPPAADPANPASEPEHTSAPPALSARPVDDPPDEFTGLGGDYIRDPVTGVRTRAAPAA
jgi:hypothetical protein